jgi:uncharacterized phiE125 gp8 family phage protein
MYAPVLVTPPTIKPLTLLEARAHLRVDDDDQNGIIEGLISAATAHLDGWTGILRRCLCEQEWRADLDCFSRCMRLPLFPVISISSVVYRDAQGAEQPIDAARYGLRIDGRGGYVRFNNDFGFPSIDANGAAVSLVAKYGYANVPAQGAGAATSSVPEDIKTAMLMLLSHWYEHREAVVIGNSAAAPVVLPKGVDALLAPYRRLTL